MATQKADGSIYIKTEIDTTEAKASVKEIASLLKRLSNQVKTIGKSMEKAMSGGIKAPDAKGMDVVEEKAKTVAKKLEKTAQAEKKLDNIDIKTTALDTLDKAIETTGQKLAELEKAQMDVFNRNQSATSSPAFLALESAAEKLGRQYDELLAKKKQLDSGTTTAQPTEKVRTAPITGNYAKTASEESEKALNALNKEISKTDAKERSLVNTNSRLGSSFKNVSQSADSAKTKTGGISSVFSRMGGVVSGLGKRLGGLAQNFTSTTNSANNASFSIGRMVGMSILYSTVFGMISKVNSGIMTGINNLAQYSSATNASISSMMSARM